MTTRTDGGEASTQRTREGVLAWSTLAALCAFFVSVGWDRGPDVLVDYGRELYVPWRLLEGDRLYADIAWFNGPLAPWTCALWMRVFGVSLDALQLLDALVLAATLGLLVRLLSEIADRRAAWVGGLAFLGIFGVSQQEAIGNYLFLAPYSHGMTFGFAAGLVALLALARSIRTSAAAPPLVGGVAIGLAFLTKAEVFLAVAASSCAVGLVAVTSERTRGRRGRLVALVALGIALPIGIAFARLVSELGAEAAPLALAGTWPYVVEGGANDLPFYRAMRGTDDLAASLARMGVFTAGTALFLGAVYAIARRTSVLVAVLVSAGATVAALAFVDTKWLFLPLPIALVVLFVGGVQEWSRRRSIGSADSPALALGFLVLAFALLPKVLFVPLARQYGFVLVVPGAMLAVAALMRWIPDRIAPPGRSRDAASAAGAAVVLVVTAAHMYTTAERFADKTYTFAAASDRILTEGWRGRVLSAVERNLAQRLEPDDTLLVVPEGIVFNYVLRLRTPTPVVNFMPPELAFFDERAIVAALQDEPPDVVVVVHRPTDMYGFPFFGEGYGEELAGWIADNYRRDALFGDEPLEDGLLGAAILVPRGR
ncbi:MAG: glycosyltransferase family 39 protein [Planctomycetota bacterium]